MLRASRFCTRAGGLARCLSLSAVLMATTPGFGQVPQTVDAGGDVGLYTAIALDDNDIPHISYYDATNRNLKYATRSGNTWTRHTVDTGFDVGVSTSIAVASPIALPFVSYYDQGNEFLKLAHKENAASSIWTIETCCEARLVNTSTSVALNQLFVNPIIAFFDVNDRSLKLAMFDRADVFSSPPLAFPDWGIEIVTTASNMEDVSLALDSGEEPHIAYIDQQGTTAQLKYAKKTCLASGCLSQITQSQQTGEGTWSFETVPSAGMVADFVSIAVTPGGNPHIAYYAAGELKYAVRNGGGTWTIESVPDAAANVGEYPSIALDSNGDPHISYYDASNGDLKYAAKTAGTWTVTVVDAGGDVGTHTALALDAADDPHISYYDVTNGDLKYAGTPPTVTDGNCCNGGAMAMLTFIPLLGAAFWRRRISREGE